MSNKFRGWRASVALALISGGVAFAQPGIQFSQPVIQQGAGSGVPASPPTLSAAEIAALPFEVEDQGPHHQTVSARDQNGNVVSRYTELVLIQA